MRVLLTAPYVGEIGWELMSWQGRVRLAFHRGRFDRLVVLGAQGKSAFYDDMPLDYVPVDLACVPGEACEDRRAVGPDRQLPTAEALHEIVRPAVDRKREQLGDQARHVEVFWPEYNGTIYSCDPRHQMFIPFHRPVACVPPAPWVVLVQRSRGFGAVNWPAEAWFELSERLADRGVHTSLYPNGSQAAIEAASHCDLAVGQSTGGLHLASLCGCPHVAWSVRGDYPHSRLQMTDRQRYQVFWNPLATPVLFHPVDAHPAPVQVENWVMTALARIGRRTGSPLRRFQFRQQWHVKDWIIRHVVECRSFRQWPWPVQRFVRWELV